MNKERKIAYIANAPDSGAALYNTFKEINDNIELEGKIFDRNELYQLTPSRIRTVLRKYTVLIFDSPYTCNFILQAFPFLKKEKKLISWWHINESEKQQRRKEWWMETSGVDSIWVTDDRMFKFVSEWISSRPPVFFRGTTVQRLPLLIDKGRFKKGTPPEKFTVGYLGADHAYKRWDAIDDAVASIPYNIPIVGSRRRGHEGGEYVGREQEFYDSISVYVNASAHESGPLPPIEALQCGKPIVSTPVGMIPWLHVMNQGPIKICYPDLSNLKECIEDVMLNYKTYYNYAQGFDFEVDYKRYEDAIRSI